MVTTFFVFSVILGLAIYFTRNKTMNYALVILHLALLTTLNIHEYAHQDKLEDRFFRADSLGFIFFVVLTIISSTTLIHSYIYNEKRKESMRKIALHNVGFVGLITSIVGVLLSTHIGLMWAFIEATTLSVAVLIYHDRDRLSLEATWKYIFVASVGIALAFTGILFLGIAFQGAGNIDFTIDAIKQSAGQLDPIWLKVSFLFVLTGFSVKMGIVPLFNVDIDAKDVSPSPIGAMFSSALLNVGFVAIFRFYECFAQTSILEWMNKVLMISGILSIFFATVYLLKVQNYKRAFAYSSMEHAGIAIIALATGGVGYFAAILHLVLHSFTKASIFYQIGQIHRVYQSKHETHLGGYFKINPYGATVMLLALFSVLAMPPFGMFISEFLTFKALANKGHWFILMTMLVLLSFIVFSLTRKFLVLLFGEMPTHKKFSKNNGGIHPAETITQFILLGLVLYCGVVQPDMLKTYIEGAVKLLAVK
ncbi:MAG: hypothetical protein EAZ08_05060 [Cytophagales bacterium]|nr:MAG: hypothetical protein EAZ08_05060 [Cytophagales bacterium]